MKTNSAFAVVALLILTACSTLGIQPAKTIEERLAYAYAAHTATLEAATSSINNRALSSQDAKRILDELDKARSALDATKAAISAGDIGTAEGRLALALSVLTAIQELLNSKAQRT